MSANSNKTLEEKEALARQLSTIRCRIRDNATAAISFKLDEVKKPYKPQKAHDPNDKTWKSLVEDHDFVMIKIEAMKRTTDVKKRNDIVRSLREKFPKIAKKFPAPQDPVEKTAPAPAAAEKSTSAEKSPLPRSTFTEPPPAYDSACAVPATARANQPNGLPSSSIFKPTSSSPYLPHSMAPPLPTNNLKRPAPGISSKGIKQENPIDLDAEEDFDENSPEPEDPAEDDDYNPTTDPTQPKSRKERADNRATKRVRTEDFNNRLKRAITKPALEYERLQLKFKYELQDIAIKKRIADIDGDKAKALALDMEASDIQYKKSKAEIMKKMQDLEDGEGKGKGESAPTA
ncbi:hypothetical protein HII31_05773 [Pseudocercospora fuligena]|uniref:Uncharacterized protein n=1 Tax=Pseudocercospora fuligena TaxID=685502 RepID=A0A8H6RKU0_9PEZI|nr:hypothetical protein HII31_05773 [Pseudocercospora fuligena]